MTSIAKARSVEPVRVARPPQPRLRQHPAAVEWLKQNETRRRHAPFPRAPRQCLGFGVKVLQVKGAPAVIPENEDGSGRQFVFSEALTWMAMSDLPASAWGGVAPHGVTWASVRRMADWYGQSAVGRSSNPKVHGEIRGYNWTFEPFDHWKMEDDRFLVAGGQVLDLSIDNESAIFFNKLDAGMTAWAGKNVIGWKPSPTPRSAAWPEVFVPVRSKHVSALAHGILDGQLSRLAKGALLKAAVLHKPDLASDFLWSSSDQKGKWEMLIPRVFSDADTMVRKLLGASMMRGLEESDGIVYVPEVLASVIPSADPESRKRKLATAAAAEKAWAGPRASSSRFMAMRAAGGVSGCDWRAKEPFLLDVTSVLGDYDAGIEGWVFEPIPMSHWAGLYGVLPNGSLYDVSPDHPFFTGRARFNAGTL